MSSVSENAVVSFPLRAEVSPASPPVSGPPAGTRQVLAQLNEQLRALEAARFAAPPEIVSTGSRALDALLPERGFRRGTLIEWLAGSPAGGAATLALLSAREALAAGGALVIIDSRRTFYPLAASRLGLALEKLIVVRPTNKANAHWAWDQALRSRGVAAVWGAVQRPDDHTLRRWQLAAESSGVLGLLLRGAEARHEPSWAEWKLWVEPSAVLVEPAARAALTATSRMNQRITAQAALAGNRRRVRVELLRGRSGLAGANAEVELPESRGYFTEESFGSWRRTSERGTHETRSVHLAAELASATTGRRSRRA